MAHHERSGDASRPDAAGRELRGEQPLRSSGGTVMGFELFERDPDHVRYLAEGVICENCGDFTPGRQVWCLSCASNALRPVSAGAWQDDKPPERDWPHWVEHHISTGRMAYFRLSAAEVKAQRERDAATHERAAAENAERDLLKRRVRERAERDPDFAALAELHGIRFDE